HTTVPLFDPGEFLTSASSVFPSYLSATLLLSRLDIIYTLLSSLIQTFPMSATGSQREAYQPPAAGSSGVGRSYVPAPAGTMFYLCAECGVKVGINKGEPIRCKECGHRILYKQRTTRYHT